MKDHGHVRLDADVPLVAGLDEIRYDALGLPFSFTGVGVHGVILLRQPASVLHVHMHHVRFHCLIHFPRILFMAGAVAVIDENRVARVKDPLHVRHRIHHALDVSRAHATPVHAVFMHYCEACIGETFLDLAHPFDPLVGILFFQIFTCLVFADGITHHTDQLCAQLLHSWDGAVNLRLGDRKIIGDLLGPVADQGAKPADFHVRFSQSGAHFFKSLLGDLM